MQNGRLTTIEGSAPLPTGYDRSTRLFARDRNDYDIWGSELFQKDWYRDVSVRRLLLDRLNVRGSERAIDVGCGDGAMLSDLAKIGCASVGVDAATELLERTAEKFKEVPTVCVRSGRFEELAWQMPTPFDVVISKNVLHLIPDIGVFFKALRSVLSPSGRLGIIETVSPTPAANSFVKELFEMAGLAYAKAHYFNKSDLVKMLADQGFQVSDVKFHRQSILLEQWLRAKEVNDRRISDCRRLVKNLSPQVKSAMRVQRVEGRFDWRLLRLQCIVVGTPLRHNARK